MNRNISIFLLIFYNIHFINKCTKQSHSRRHDGASEEYLPCQFYLRLVNKAEHTIFRQETKYGKP